MVVAAVVVAAVVVAAVVVAAVVVAAVVVAAVVVAAVVVAAVVVAAVVVAAVVVAAVVVAAVVVAAVVVAAVVVAAVVVAAVVVSAVVVVSAAVVVGGDEPPPPPPPPAVVVAAVVVGVVSVAIVTVVVVSVVVVGGGTGAGSLGVQEPYAGLRSPRRRRAATVVVATDFATQRLPFQWQRTTRFGDGQPPAGTGTSVFRTRPAVSRSLTQLPLLARHTETIFERAFWSAASRTPAQLPYSGRRSPSASSRFAFAGSVASDDQRLPFQWQTTTRLGAGQPAAGTGTSVRLRRTDVTRSLTHVPPVLRQTVRTLAASGPESLPTWATASDEPNPPASNAKTVSIATVRRAFGSLRRPLESNRPRSRTRRRNMHRSCDRPTPGGALGRSSLHWMIR